MIFRAPWDSIVLTIYNPKFGEAAPVGNAPDGVAPNGNPGIPPGTKLIGTLIGETFNPASAVLSFVCVSRASATSSLTAGIFMPVAPC